MDDRTLSEVIGTRFREMREDAGWTQSEAAAMLRLNGFKVTQSAVAGIEAGAQSVALGELLVIAGAFDVPVAELLAGNEKVRLTPQASADLDYVRSFMAGKATPRRPAVEAIRSAVKDGQRLVNRYYPGARAGIIVKAERAADSDAEQKAARALGIKALGLSLVAYRLWGVSMTEKRDAEVEKRATAAMTARSRQAVRGHVTRELVDEIRSAISR